MFKKLILPSILLAVSASAQAEFIVPNSGSFWNNPAGAGDFWTQMAAAEEDENDDVHEVYSREVGGGQVFDAEYLAYNLTGNIFSLALQTGFNLQTNNQGSYWGGDIGLSFNGLSGDYDYAIDFGEDTGSWGGRGSSQDHLKDEAGLYSVVNWNSNTRYGEGNVPFAMGRGNEVLGVDFKMSDAIKSTVRPEDGYNGNNDTYFRVVSFDLTALGTLGIDISQIDAHWTMSCANDVIKGHADIVPVPEPSALFLMATGLFGLFGSIISRRKRFNV